MYWNKDEDRYLMQNYQRQSIDELCGALNRTKHSVRWRLHYLGLVNLKRWTSKEIEYLTKNYAKTKNEDLAKKLGRTRLAIVDKACKLGLEKDQAFLYELHKRPNTGQFVKGYKTWNKGMKFENPPFCSAWFKKGHQTWNKMPDDLRELVVTLRRLKRKLNGKRLQ
jgi:hypothetical protein